MASIKLDRLMAADRYSDCQDTGSFIFIDPQTNDTIALGIIEVIKPANPLAAKANFLVSSNRPRPCAVYRKSR